MEIPGAFNINVK